ncbi:response regulator [Oscillatoria acuminata]|uniref:Response regulator with CheY-like receiver domain and winged-helix DNA-binding domain n=1 Tax=Oscillatoria acuminata PCC 6304 TaxID=56110 RepID=K9TGN1_9CYAN|nr:response regulator [Oscillatoria acuminata]AFY82032.1 response regulator with CheY-like receiver domain and winged-helix DNA-binding domain [Oscillatoria acuminata PCC 6304]
MNLVAKRKKILVVEDNLAYIHILKFAFEHSNWWAEAEIETVNDGKEAIDYLSRNQGNSGNHQGSDQLPHLILSDINMPHLSGLELLAWIRQTDHLKDLPFILMSSYIQPIELEIIQSLKANYYFIKPLTIPELLNNLNQTIKQLQLKEATVLEKL